MSDTDPYLSISTPFGDGALLLRRFSGEEAVSELFLYHLEMISETVDLDFSQIVGKEATVTIRLADDSERFIHGVVGRFSQAGSDGELAVYHAELWPKLRLLDQRSNCKVFQEKSASDIITAVLDDAGLTDYRNDLSGTYAARDYCVQYNESDFAFVARLMEDEGIFYFFEHQDGQHTLVLADASSAFADCAGASSVDYHTHSVWTQQNVVTRCRLEESLIPGEVTLDDFSFETPSTDLAASSTSTVAQNGTKRQLYEYPGGFTSVNDGESRANLRIEAHELPRRRLHGEGFCRGFMSGYKFTLARHYRDDVNTSYVLRHISHSGSLEGGYTNSFEAFAADVTFRPPRTTRKPTIPGSQTAIVVGKSGEEIWCDNYGRVKVQFHWDRVGQSDENSSCWIRVAQGWAGKAFGQFFLPRIGQEVVVSFLNGDPDRPLITGAVYNAEQTVPLTLPDQQVRSIVKTQSSKGGGGANQLWLDDTKDSEQVYFEAEKNFDRVVKNNDTLKVGFEKKDAGDQTIDVYNNRTATIENGNDSLEVKTGDRTVKVTTGQETHEVAGTRTLSVTGAESHTSEDNFDHTVTKDFTLTVEGNLTIDVTGTVTLKSGSAMNIQSGASLQTKASGSLTNSAGGSLTNSAGGALTNSAGSSLTNQASGSMTNEAGATMTNKASASQTVDGGGMLTLKGGMVGIN